jgi:hypothetical protein
MKTNGFAAQMASPRKWLCHANGFAAQKERWLLHVKKQSGLAK